MKKDVIVVLSSVSILLTGFIFLIFTRNREDHNRILYQGFRYIEELNLYFCATDNYQTVEDGVFQILFSGEKGGFKDPKTCNYMCNTDSSFTTKGILKKYDPGLRFCQIDGSLICVVSENVIYRSVDYPIVTYDKEGYFIWNGKRHWLLDCSYICVYCPVYHSPGMVHWYPYDPKIDSWSNELFKTDAIKDYMSIPNDEFLKKHNKTYFPSTREIWSIHQDGGQVFRNGEWVFWEFSPVPIIVRNKIEEDE